MTLKHRRFLSRLCLSIGLVTGFIGVPTIQAQAGDLVLLDQVMEGALIRGKAEPGARVSIGDQTLRVSAQGDFAFGIDRDGPDAITVNVEWADGTVDEKSYTVAPRKWDVQRIDGLPPSKVTPRTPEQIAKIKKDAETKWLARNHDTDETGFTDNFIWPVKGIISGRFGNQRVLNGKDKPPHYGIDIAAPKGTDIVAPAAGIITLAEKDLYFEGGTVFIDHGHGITDIFLHMSRIDVEVGQRVEQGDVIGAVGASGRATGPHLCWRMYWRDAHVDPSLLAGEMTAQD